jgi:hypothetical protein
MKYSEVMIEQKVIFILHNYIALGNDIFVCDILFKSGMTLGL